MHLELKVKELSGTYLMTHLSNLRSLLIIKRDIRPALAFHYDSETNGNENIAQQTLAKIRLLFNERNFPSSP